ncbi:L-rhamnose mutarotase [Lactobacillus sp. PSON]|uniref:L-rhamnose mutarotase n=1 Tax=Lactobacillus sp. PSON TaxID=3455454 RepID=UPI0040426FD1
MSTKLGRITHINNFNDMSFDFIKMKNILVDVGIVDSAIYFDEKENKLFVYLEINNYKKYTLISKKYSSKWWSNLNLINDISSNENSLDYAWKHIFKIKD